MKNVATVKKTNEIMVEFGIYPKKNFGQNFIVVPKTVIDIVENSKIDQDATIIEIGPGVGALTDVLLDRFKKVICFEIDKTLITPLKETFKEYTNFELYNEDILKVDLVSFIEKNLKNEKVVIVSNLPYYITSEILIKLFQCPNVLKVVAMMQKEVAHRILKSDKGKDENELTILAKHYTSFKLIKEVSKNDFFPKPSIDSSVLLFDLKQNVSDITSIVKTLFKQRRKTIYNNLIEVYDKQLVLKCLNDLHINVSLRPETLDMIDIERINAYLNQKMYFAPCKINLNLQIFDKENEKHNLKSIMQKLNLFDEIIIFEDNKLTIETYPLKVAMEDNTVYKIIKEVEKIINQPINLNIKIIKNIPSLAGLGGGSSDAGCVLKYLANKYHLNEDQMLEVSAKVGSDIPSFIYDGTTLISKQGENVKKIEDNSTFYYLLIKDNFGISTKDAYRLFDEMNEHQTFDFASLEKGLINNDLTLVNENLKNDLLKPAIKLDKRILKMLNELPNSMMSGSGSTIFKIYKTFEEAQIDYEKLYKKYQFIKILQKV